MSKKRTCANKAPKRYLAKDEIAVVVGKDMVEVLQDKMIIATTTSIEEGTPEPKRWITDFLSGECYQIPTRKGPDIITIKGVLS